MGVYKRTATRMGSCASISSVLIKAVDHELKHKSSRLQNERKANAESSRSLLSIEPVGYRITRWPQVQTLREIAPPNLKSVSNQNPPNMKYFRKNKKSASQLKQIPKALPRLIAKASKITGPEEEISRRIDQRIPKELAFQNDDHEIDRGVSQPAPENTESSEGFTASGLDSWKEQRLKRDRNPKPFSPAPPPNLSFRLVRKQDSFRQSRTTSSTNTLRPEASTVPIDTEEAIEYIDQLLKRPSLLPLTAVEG